ncbi:MAG: glycosyltransferase [Bacteroidales bacterium]|nr:glycosyltransferase [Bacteroidales bacterium]
MNVVEINTYNFGSTGTIMLEVSERLREAGHRVLVCYPAIRRNRMKEVTDSYWMRTRVERKLGMILSRWLGCEDLFFRLSTWRLVRKMDRFGVDLVHLHNLHGWYVNIPVLFRYLRKKKIPVVWTLHDCWALTGHCAHFERIGCEKWKADCKGCPQYRDYPHSRIDNARRLLRVKRRFIEGTPGLTLVAPSEWLASLARKSYLKESPVSVIYNGIDTEVFRPTESDFRARWHLEGKTILLGVAMLWGMKKGLDVFVRLAHELDDRYGFVLVGTDDDVDKSLPARVVSIHRTMDQRELAAIYTAADLFVNPTREEVFGLVNVEALACGTPVLTYDTGGSPESLDAGCGNVVARDDYDALKAEIERIATTRPYSPEVCRARALRFSGRQMQDAYLRLFEEITAP